MSGAFLRRPSMGATNRLQTINGLLAVIGKQAVDLDLLVGVAGFEPTTSSSRTKRAAKLRYTPMSLLYCSSRRHRYFSPRVARDEIRFWGGGG